MTACLCCLLCTIDIIKFYKRGSVPKENNTGQGGKTATFSQRQVLMLITWLKPVVRHFCLVSSGCCVVWVTDLAWQWAVGQKPSSFVMKGGKVSVQMLCVALKLFINISLMFQHKRKFLKCLLWLTNKKFSYLTTDHFIRNEIIWKIFTRRFREHPVGVV